MIDYSITGLFGMHVNNLSFLSDMVYMYSKHAYNQPERTLLLAGIVYLLS